ncbi:MULTISPECIES: CRISPR-associated endonuclease Cas2 [Kurthia]|uniref:CRISPR-associated endonuclease Cas2 n=1 Tax=Kurthia TaxID=1649 RepID=UPI002D5794EA|nr:CRISPR-associated endonuclease Cas2 [Kurthia gibsonii]
MRMIIFFDLPVETAIQKRHYRQFRKYLIESGYFMMQYSVYSKIILNPQSMQYHRAKLLKQLPPHGLVEALVVTEKQYANIETLVGNTIERDENHSTNRTMDL